MKVAIVFVALVAVAVAAPPQPTPESEAIILKSDSVNDGENGYRYNYETSNGIVAQEQGQLTNAGAENEAIAVQGEFQYVGPDGVTYHVAYVADENGFQPQGAHLPVAP